MIIVQHIQVQWTKASRGGPAATTRNAVPEVRDLPWFPDVSPEPALIVHMASFREATGFRPTETVTTETLGYQERRTIGSIALMLHLEELRVIYAYTMDQGAPERFGIPRQVASLGMGTWCQVSYNGRWSSNWQGAWSYHKDVLNIAFASSLSRPPFPGSPAATFHDLADLR